MKAVMMFVVSCSLFASAYALADCGSGSCGDGSCNSYESNCQCTDPACNRPWDSDCISRSYCCEAFGNPGGR